MNRIRRLPRRAAALGALFLAVCLAPPAAADLIFVDDFEDPNVRHSSPAPGQPGGGAIGGQNFWTRYKDPTNTGDQAVENDRLLLTSANPTIAHSVSRIISTSHHLDLNFMDAPMGQGLLFSLRGLEMDWTDGYGLFFSGFWTSGTVNSTKNAFLFVVNAETGTVLLRAKQDYQWSYFPLLTPVGAERPVRVDLYLDSIFYMLDVHYDDNSVAGLSGSHLFDSAHFDSLGLHLILEANQTHSMARVYVDEVTVTRIPEPGTLGFALAALGAAWVSRRRR